MLAIEYVSPSIRVNTVTVTTPDGSTDSDTVFVSVAAVPANNYASAVQSDGPLGYWRLGETNYPDHDYGDSRYAREDTKMALRHAKLAGITPFCITIDRESEEQLRDMYGEVGYTIIDDVLSLPERMPAIYRRLAT